MADDDGSGAITYPIVDGIPRFVDSALYAAAFGFQWQSHSETQLDSKTGWSISRDRLERCIGAPLASIDGLRVLEAGCGAGRFTELLVEAGAVVHSIDMSQAVEVNRANIGDRENYVVAQADLTLPPFPPASFDLVVCLGVLQHTPSPAASIAALWRMVKPGGRLVIDQYRWSLSIVTKIADPILRPVLKRMAPDRSKRVTDALTRWFFPVHWAIKGVPLAQPVFSRISPVLVYFTSFPQLSKEEHYEWARLDTYDHLTDYYKRLCTAGKISRTLTKLGATDISVRSERDVVGASCTKPQ